MELLEVFLALFFVGRTEEESFKRRLSLVVSVVISCTLLYYLVYLLSI